MVNVSPSKNYTCIEVPFSAGKFKASKPHSVRGGFDSRSHHKSMLDRDYSRMSTNAQKHSARMVSARQASASFLDKKKRNPREPLHEYINKKSSADKPLAPTPVEIPAFESKMKPKKVRAPQLVLEESDGRIATKAKRFGDYEKNDFMQSRNNSFNEDLEKGPRQIEFPFGKDDSLGSLRKKVNFVKEPTSVLFNDGKH